MVRDAITARLEELSAEEHIPLLTRAVGTIRIELRGERPERWYVSLNKGRVDVSHRNAKADCVVRCDREVFGRILAGTDNALTAILRGVVEVDGDLAILVQLQRLHPGAAA